GVPRRASRCARGCPARGDRGRQADIGGSRGCGLRVVVTPIHLDFARASVAFFAGMLCPDETGIYVFKIGTVQGFALFEVAYVFEENGYDFRVLISNFGLP